MAKVCEPVLSNSWIKLGTLRYRNFSSQTEYFNIFWLNLLAQLRIYGLQNLIHNSSVMASHQGPEQSMGVDFGQTAKLT